LIDAASILFFRTCNLSWRHELRTQAVDMIKFIFTTLRVALAMVAASDVAFAAVDLATKWDIGDPRFEYNLLEFDLVYPVSPLVDASMIAFALYDSEKCQEGGDDITSNNYISSSIEESLSPDGDTKDMRLAFIINPAMISVAPIYTQTTKSNAQATIRVCIRFSEYTADPTQNKEAIEVNFLENIVAINVDIESGFAIASIDSFN
jgi:hypothetical protein